MAYVVSYNGRPLAKKPTYEEALVKLAQYKLGYAFKYPDQLIIREVNEYGNTVPDIRGKFKRSHTC